MVQYFCRFNTLSSKFSLHCNVALLLLQQRCIASPRRSICCALKGNQFARRFRWQLNLYGPCTPRLLRYYFRPHRLHCRVSRGAGAAWLSRHRLQEIKNGAREFALWANLRKSCELPREFTVSLFFRRRVDHLFHVRVAEFLALRSSPTRRDPAHFQI